MITYRVLDVSRKEGRLVTASMMIVISVVTLANCIIVETGRAGRPRFHTFVNDTVYIYVCDEIFRFVKENAALTVLVIAISNNW